MRHRLKIKKTKMTVKYRWGSEVPTIFFAAMRSAKRFESGQKTVAFFISIFQEPQFLRLILTGDHSIISVLEF